jgi:hypothetical protein
MTGILYPITYVNKPIKFTPDNIIAINAAAHTVTMRLTEYTGLPPVETFTAVFGPRVRTWFTPTLVGLDALTKWEIIRWASPEKVSWELAIHELMHLLCARAKNKPLKGLYKLDTIAGSLLPGSHPPSTVGYNLTEKFCNAGEAYFRHAFADNAAGKALAAHFDAGMPEWVAVAMGRKA